VTLTRKATYILGEQLFVLVMYLYSGEQLFVLVMYHFNPHKIPQYEFVPILKTTHHYAYLVTYLCKKYMMKIGLKQHWSVAQNNKFLALKMVKG